MSDKNKSSVDDERFKSVVRRLLKTPPKQKENGDGAKAPSDSASKRRTQTRNA